MFQFITRLFGTQSDRDIKQLKPYVKKINDFYDQLASLSDDALRAETDKLRAYIAKEVAGVEKNIEGLRVQALGTQDIKAQFDLFKEIDRYKKIHNKKTEKALLELLPRAFAIVKETARRFKEHGELVVRATDVDRALAERYDHVRVEEDKAVWANRWEVGGNAFTWDMVHYDVQLMGGVVLHQGKIAEMATGEGKTLAATLPIFLNALSKKGVHVITVNDYLARRDAAWMGPLFEFHGISVGCIEGTPIQSKERRAAYAADVTYGTNSGFAFDFLYDNIAKAPGEQVQRDFFYVVIDEIDEALIDGARTPYIISGPRGEDNSKVYRALKQRVKQMYQAQQRLVVELLKDAKEKIADNNKDEGGVSLFRAYRGLPTYTPLVRFLSEKGIKKILANTESFFLEENSKRMPEADAPLFFTIDKKNDVVDVTDKGIAFFSQGDGDKDFFVLPDIAMEVDRIERGEADDEEKIAQKKAIMDEYGERAARIHAVNQLLKAYTLFQKNVDYVVMDGEVKIVDEKTGRILKGRRFSDGLHEGLEAKEDVRIAKPSQTYATITPPNLFRRYHKLSGMTGTAATEAIEFLEIYGLEVVSIPTNKPVVRKDLPDRIYKTEREKLDAIAAMVRRIQSTTNRPILVVTSSVEVSERMRRMLNVPPNRVLNAKNHHLEANIIAEAGQPNALTIATQMAGRGTDIKVADEAEEEGGLCVIITEINETIRVTLQIRGRAGRQGQRGSSVRFASLEDSLIFHWQQGPLGKQVDRIWKKEGEVLIDKMITKIIVGIQKDKAQSHFLSRKRSLEYDNVMDKQREVIYRRRNHALKGQRLSFDTMYSIYHSIREVVPEELTRDETGTVLSLVELGLVKEAVTKIIQTHGHSKAVKALYGLAREKQEAQERALADFAYEKLKAVKGETHAILPIQCGEDRMKIDLLVADVVASSGLSAIPVLQSVITLSTIDGLWTHHLQDMDDLKDYVTTASYENKDPLLVFKIEGVRIFKGLLHAINKRITRQILNYTVIEDELVVQEEGLLQTTSKELQANKEVPNEGDVVPNEPARVEHSISRNERVTVRYSDGTVREDVKYKTVAEDVVAGRCTVVDV